MPNIAEPAASALIGADDAVVTAYATGFISEKFNEGKPFSRLSILMRCTDGEASIILPGAVDGLTPQFVQAAKRNLNFVRVKLIGLSLSARGDGKYNLAWSGSAEKAEIVTAPASTKN